MVYPTGQLSPGQGVLYPTGFDRNLDNVVDAADTSRSSGEYPAMTISANSVEGCLISYLDNGLQFSKNVARMLSSCAYSCTPV